MSTIVTDSADRYFSFFKQMDESSGNREIFESVKELDHHLSEKFYSLGVEDGTIGKRNDKIPEYAEENAASLQQIVNSKLKGLNRNIEKRLEEANKSADEVRNEISKLERYRSLTRANNKYLPKFFLGGSALLYAFVGCLLVAADIALSWQFARDIFDLQENDIIFTAVISIGLGLLTIYVKIFYDQFIAVPDGVSRIRYKEIRELIGDKNDWRFLGEMILKFIFGLIILSALLLIFVFLASSRLAVISKNHSMLKENINAKWLFLLMNIVMPIVAGVCFSIAQKIYMNRIAFKNLNVNVSEKGGDLEKINKEIINAENQKVEIQSILDNWSSKEIFIQHFKGMYELAYFQGYQRGYVNPDGQDKELSLIQRVEAYRSRLFARKMRTLNAQM